ncbi:Metalloreductase STEAP2 [Brachionus plicatilis]|uniref:Metalloreductase STEAP2 n=1 Tax=Brachionus plicatilis TaxID=10195 RepID=A0A3M7R7L7_BRAPC|nr:Metalloreductase STEAP2 [Brachionus plicatilis]
MSPANREKITVIGTGNYAISISKLFLHHGHEVIFGSRNPNLNYLKQNLSEFNERNFNVFSIEDAWMQSESIIFLAILADEAIYENFAEKICQLLSRSNKQTSKIIVEISNWTDKNQQISNAERLQNLFKDKLDEKSILSKINVIKAFNLINAYSLSNPFESPTKANLANLEFRVPVAGDSEQAKQKLIDLCAQVGILAYNYGDLQDSLQLEKTNSTTFSEWKIPSLISFGFLAFNFIWVFLIYFYFPKKPQSFSEYLADFSLLSHTNKVLGFTTLNLLAFVYFAYVIASIFQLKYGTKYQKFPSWLDNWLKSRKQLGLLAFLIGTFHAIASLFVTNPQYLKDWHYKLSNGVGRMTLNGELNILTGITAYLLMIIVALTSINSIGNSLNWSEWRFVQSKMGISCLTMGLVHDALMYFRIYNEKDENNYSLVYLVTRVKLIAIYFPLMVLISRFILAYCTPISRRLELIRNGSVTCNQKEN